MNKTIRVNIEQIILEPAVTVFDAIVHPEQMSKYFISEASGPMAAGKTIRWTFADVGATLQVKVQELVLNERIVFSWEASGTETTVELVLQPVKEQETLVHVTETGWEMDETGVQRALQQTQGWTDMLLCLKAYLEYGISLRRGKSQI